jgi:hypothetical protein
VLSEGDDAQVIDVRTMPESVVGEAALPGVTAGAERQGELTK